jgi:glycosyltransferase involved in cell wall biosynthesis
MEMNVLLVSTQDYLHHPIPSRHHYIFEELAKNHEIHVPHFHVSRGKERTTKLHVHEATLIPIKDPLFHYSLNAPYHFAKFDQIIKQNSIEIVVTSHILAGMAVIHAAKKYRVPIIFDVKDWFPDSAAAYYHSPMVKRLVYTSVETIMDYNLKKSDIITTVSPSLVHKLEEKGFPSQLITNGVDTDLFFPMDSSQAKRILGIPADAFVIGFEGAVEKWFALDDVVRALPKILKYVENTRLLIVGDSLFTDFKAQLISLVHAMGLSDNVIFTGSVPYDNLAKYIAAMDLCLIPFAPQKWLESALPNKFFEYSACGKRILSVKLPDMIALAPHNVEYYQDMEEFVEKVKESADDIRSYSSDMSEFSWKKKATEFEQIFFKIQANHSAIQ